MDLQKQARHQKLQRVLQETDTDCILLTAPKSLGYFTGNFEDGHERMLFLAIHADGRRAILCPSLSELQFKRNGETDLLPWPDGVDPVSVFAQLAEAWGMRTAVIAVEDSMRADHLIAIQDHLPAAKFKSGGSYIARVRGIKDQLELDHLRKAGSIVDEVYEEVLPMLKPGLTELEVQDWLLAGVKARGARTTFCVVATGPYSAEPHHATCADPVQEGILLMDFGCEWEGYQADITRVVCLGKATEKMKQVYSAVYEAHMVALAAAKPGATGAEVDAAGRKVIESRGYGQYFIHRTGHGIGLSGHEEPNISSDNVTPLVRGNAFSIEPGIYLPGEFGVRLENIVACGLAGDDVVSMNAAISPTLVEL